MKTVESKREIRNNGGWILVTILGLCLNLFLFYASVNIFWSIVMIILSIYSLWRFLKGR